MVACTAGLLAQVDILHWPLAGSTSPRRLQKLDQLPRAGQRRSQPVQPLPAKPCPLVVAAWVVAGWEGVGRLMAGKDYRLTRCHHCLLLLLGGARDDVSRSLKNARLDHTASALHLSVAPLDHTSPHRSLQRVVQVRWKRNLAKVKPGQADPLPRSPALQASLSAALPLISPSQLFLCSPLHQGCHLRCHPSHPRWLCAHLRSPLSPPASNHSDCLSLSCWPSPCSPCCKNLPGLRARKGGNLYLEPEKQISKSCARNLYLYVFDVFSGVGSPQGAGRVRQGGRKPILSSSTLYTRLGCP